MRAVSTSTARMVGGASWQDRAAQAALFGLLGIVLIGLDPLGAREKTIPATGEGDISRQLSYVLLFGIAVVSTAAHRDLRRLLVIPMSVSALIVYCWLSLFWAIQPAVGARRLILTTMIVWIIFRVVQHAGYERTVAAIRTMLILTLVLNYVAIVVTPAAVHAVAEVGDPALAGNWRGVLPHKNFAGAVCAFTILIFAFDARRFSALVRLAIIVLSLFFLYKSSSKTSLGLLVVAGGLGLLYTFYNPRYRMPVMFGLSLLLLLGALVAHLYWAELTAPFERPDAFTGRTQIWPVLLAYANDNWLTGSGYGSFWNIGPDTPVYNYAKGWVAGLGNGHNGYIDMLIHLGYPGLVLTVVMVLVVPLLRLLVSVNPNRQSGALLLTFLIFCAGHNFTESSLFDRDMIVQVFLMFTIALIGQVAQGLPRRGPVPVRGAGAVHRIVGRA